LFVKTILFSIHRKFKIFYFYFFFFEKTLQKEGTMKTTIMVVDACSNGLIVVPWGEVGKFDFCIRWNTEKFD